MISRRWSWPRRGLELAVGTALLLFVGAVAARRPAVRPSAAPVTLSRVSGQAETAGDSEAQRLGDSGLAGPYLISASPSAFDGRLAQLPQKPVVKGIKQPEPELGENENASRPALRDPVLQGLSGPARPSQAMPRLLENFAGLNFDDNGAGWPPDTNGDVGPNHYVQVVNTSIGIFSKSGTPLLAMTLDTFFQNAPAPCDSNNNGDPVVLYDARADRWVVTDFAWQNIDAGPHYECIAASKTGDPTGGWWYYALRADDEAHPYLNDYPKLGVWPDGIYMSANMFACSTSCNLGTFVGARVYAISPTQLYNGSVLTTVVFDTGSAYFSLLPANVHGAAPPAGRPNYFVANDSHVIALDVFKFHVDWTHPLSSTFSAPVQVPEAVYSAPPGTVPVLNGNPMDSLNDRLMMQNQYRNLAGEESVWVAHGANTPTGIRWYQLDVSGGSVAATPVQQGTYAPADGLNRWMPSLAVDKFGNMAVGYSAASSVQYADIRYAGRLVSDTLGTLGQQEAVLIAGSGAQNNSCGSACTRWGDYSAMTVDPVDDCTFWYTSEYYTALGGSWQTRIGSFRYPLCGPEPLPLPPKTYLPVVSLPAIGGGSGGNWTTLMQADFETAWPGPGWQVTDPGFDEYYWARRGCRAATGTASAWAMGGGSVGGSLGCGANYPDNSNAWMVYGPFSTAGATAGEFQAKLWLNSEPSYDVACLLVSVDNSNFYTSNAGTCFSGSSGGAFVPTALDLGDVYVLGNALGHSNVWVAMVFQSDDSVNFAEGAYVDDLLLQKCSGTCSAPDAPSDGLHGATAKLKRP
jgi:hypothetical protein